MTRQEAYDIIESWGIYPSLHWLDTMTDKKVIAIAISGPRYPKVVVTIREDNPDESPVPGLTRINESGQIETYTDGHLWVVLPDKE